MSLRNHRRLVRTRRPPMTRSSHTQGWTLMNRGWESPELKRLLPRQQHHPPLAMIESVAQSPFNIFLFTRSNSCPLYRLAHLHRFLKAPSRVIMTIGKIYHQDRLLYKLEALPYVLCIGRVGNVLAVTFAYLNMFWTQLVF